MANVPPSTTPGIRHERHYLHPYLISLFPAVHLFVSNQSEVDLADVFLPVVLVLATAAVVYALARRLGADAEQSAVMASWALAAFFSYGPIREILGSVMRMVVGGDGGVRGEVAALTWIVLWLGPAVWALRAILRWKPVNDLFRSFAVILLAILALEVSLEWLPSGRSEPPAEADTWVQTPIGLHQPGTPRDIYFLVFDRYAGANTLRQVYGLDNSPFLERLRSRGFAVPEASRANYPRTVFSICSTMNLGYLPDQIRPDFYYARLIDDHSVGRALHGLGYEYHHFGNWYQPLRSNSNADAVFPVSTFPSEYADALYAMTPLSQVFRFGGKYEHVTRKFRGVSDVARNEGPTFVYAHFLLPHSPYVLNSDGGKTSWRERRFDDPKSSYARQVEGTNALMLETVDSILEMSNHRPIIVLQADEGPYLADENRDRDQQQQIMARTSVFSAMLLPDIDAESMVPHTMSPVNTFRLVFREYFGAQIELLPDRTFYWEHADELGRPTHRSTQFVDVTDLVAE